MRQPDSQALNPAAWKLAVGVTVGAVLFLALVVGGIAAVGHRNDVIAQLTADWGPVAGDSSVQLSIWPTREDRAPAITPLELSGEVDGQRVNAEVKVPRWPPMGSTAYAVVGGARWELRVDLAEDTLTVITADGRTFTLSSAR